MVDLWLEKQKKRQKRQVSTKLIASLAPARAEIEAGVVAKADQQKENSRQLVSCLKSMCDRVKENVAEESKQKKQASFDSYSSIMLDTDDIPLIDESPSTEDVTDFTPVSYTRPVSYSEDYNRSIQPHRRSVVSCNPQPYQVLNTSLPQKQLDGLSPDVFHLRAPLVSWENFMTPAGSAETIFVSSDGTRLENRQ